MCVCVCVCVCVCYSAWFNINELISNCLVVECTQIQYICTYMMCVCVYAYSIILCVCDCICI